MSKTPTFLALFIPLIMLMTFSFYILRSNRQVWQVTNAVDFKICLIPNVLKSPYQNNLIFFLHLYIYIYIYIYIYNFFFFSSFIFFSHPYYLFLELSLNQTWPWKGELPAKGAWLQVATSTSLYYKCHIQLQGLVIRKRNKIKRESQAHSYVLFTENDRFLNHSLLIEPSILIYSCAPMEFHNHLGYFKTSY